MNKIITNDKFDRLTNLDISTYYRNEEFYIMKDSFTGAFAYWLVSQSPYDAPDITLPLTAFNDYIDSKFPRIDKIPEKFTFDNLQSIINTDVFESIPEIEQLNHCKIGSCEGFENRYERPHPDYDFIDLGALSRNVFFMILREYITQS